MNKKSQENHLLHFSDIHLDIFATKPLIIRPEHFTELWVCMDTHFHSTESVNQRILLYEIQHEPFNTDVSRIIIITFCR